jgi:hypothetical protein
MANGLSRSRPVQHVHQRGLTFEGFADDVLSLIEFCISNVPKDEHVIKALQMALSCILDERLREDEPGRPTVDFDQKQLETAWDLLHRLGELTDTAPA